MEKNIVLPDSFKGERSFTINIKEVGEVKVEYSDFYFPAYHFGLRGFVSETGYKSNFLYPKQFEKYATPEEVAEALAIHLFENEGGKELKEKRKIEYAQKQQLSLF